MCWIWLFIVGFVNGDLMEFGMVLGEVRMIVFKGFVIFKRCTRFHGLGGVGVTRGIG
jgi:hypothetical protein